MNRILLSIICAASGGLAVWQGMSMQQASEARDAAAIQKESNKWQADDLAELQKEVNKDNAKYHKDTALIEKNLQTESDRRFGPGIQFKVIPGEVGVHSQNMQWMERNSLLQLNSDGNGFYDKMVVSVQIADKFMPRSEHYAISNVLANIEFHADSVFNLAKIRLNDAVAVAFRKNDSSLTAIFNIDTGSISEDRTIQPNPRLNMTTLKRFFDWSNQLNQNSAATALAWNKRLSMGPGWQH